MELPYDPEWEIIEELLEVAVREGINSDNPITKRRSELTVAYWDGKISPEEFVKLMEETDN